MDFNISVTNGVKQKGGGSVASVAGWAHVSGPAGSKLLSHTEGQSKKNSDVSRYQQ